MFPYHLDQYSRNSQERLSETALSSFISQEPSLAGRVLNTLSEYTIAASGTLAPQLAARLPDSYKRKMFPHYLDQCQRNPCDRSNADALLLVIGRDRILAHRARRVLRGRLNGSPLATKLAEFPTPPRLTRAGAFLRRLPFALHR